MRLPLPRSPLTGVLSAAALLSVGGAGLALHTSSGSAASASTRTVTVAKGVVQSTASGTGNLAAANELDLNFGTSGTVSKVYVKEGEHVSQGQLIARLDSDSQKVALAQAKADLTSAEDTADSVGTTSTASAGAEDTATTTSAVMDDSTQVTMISAADTPATTPAASTPETGSAATTPTSTGTTS
ncbi:MAG: biotin/lipoyl-binding protein, partial [Solirubrobacteraceae bacterium]|nr:biotin/lipoyl-binding protein [Patulibacter sp.]